MKGYDKKKLWARSGNVCSFPGCEIELVEKKRVSRVLGEEAHIKGEKSEAPRYDPDQSPTDRESYENHILLCPTHHTKIDADPDTYTVKSLHAMKKSHEEQVVKNRQYPELRDELIKVLQKFEPSIESLDPIVSEVYKDIEDTKCVRVDASIEEGINTNLKVSKGQKLLFFARGLISFDGRKTFTTPEGVLCNEYGLPIIAKNTEGNYSPVVWPHQLTYETNGRMPGFVGALYGWINEYDPDKAFHIGSKKEIEVSEEGYLYLAVNDAKGTYADNDGEFRVDIQVLENNLSDY